MARSEAFAKLSWLMMLAAMAIVVGALYLAKDVLVPFTLAVLLSFLLAPICDWLERWRIGRIPAVISTALLAFTVLGLVTWMVALQLTELAAKLPEYKDNIEEKVQSVNGYVLAAQSKFSRATDGIGEKLSAAESQIVAPSPQERTYPVRVIPPVSRPVEIIGGMFGTVFQFVATAGVVVIFVIFFLVRREDLRDRFIQLIGQGQITVTTQALDDAASRLSRYLSMQLLINATYGLPVAIGLHLLGIPNAILWGVLATVLRFIPYLGPWIAATMPVALSLAVAPGWSVPLLVIGLFLTLELFSNNVMEPWLYGTRTGVSPVAVLVAAVFWTWLWGGVGLLLATPLTVCLLVIGKYVPQLSFFSVLLGDQPVFDPPTRVYQRLLAGDQEEVEEMIDEYLETKPLVEMYDELLLPAFALAEKHHHRGELDDERHKFIRECMKELVEEVGERQQEIMLGRSDGPYKSNANSSPDSPNSARRGVLCLPARDIADEIVGMMFVQVLELNGFSTQTLSAAALASEMINLVERRTGDVVCISAMPPAAVLHARYLFKRLVARVPTTNVMVGLWTIKDLGKAQSRIGLGKPLPVVGSLSAGLSQIRRMVEPVALRIDTQPESPLAPNSSAVLQPQIGIV